VGVKQLSDHRKNSCAMLFVQISWCVVKEEEKGRMHMCSTKQVWAQLLGWKRRLSEQTNSPRFSSLQNTKYREQEKETADSLKSRKW
jgi:hypothetical protein